MYLQQTENHRHAISTCCQFPRRAEEKEYAQVAIFAHGGVLICAQLYAGTIKPEEAFSALTPYGGIIHLKI